MANLKTKEAVAEINNHTIPDAIARIAEANPKFGDITIKMDADSFGNDFTELTYVSNTIGNIYDGIKSLNDRSDIAKAELEKQLKKISLKLTPGAEGKQVSFNEGELFVSTNSFNHNYILSDEVVVALEDAL